MCIFILMSILLPSLADVEPIVGDGHVHRVVNHLAIPELITGYGEERLTECWLVTRQDKRTYSMSWPLAVTQNHSMSTYEEMVLKNLLMMMSRTTPRHSSCCSPQRRRRWG